MNLIEKLNCMVFENSDVGCSENAAFVKRILAKWHACFVSKKYQGNEQNHEK